MQPFVMKNHSYRHRFHAGECPVFPPPGTGGSGRRISGKAREQEVRGKRRPVFGVRVSPKGGARQDAPVSAGDGLMGPGRLDPDQGSGQPDHFRVAL